MDVVVVVVVQNGSGAKVKSPVIQGNSERCTLLKRNRITYMIP